MTPIVNFQAEEHRTFDTPLHVRDAFDCTIVGGTHTGTRAKCIEMNPIMGIATMQHQDGRIHDIPRYFVVQDA